MPLVLILSPQLGMMGGCARKFTEAGSWQLPQEALEGEGLTEKSWPPDDGVMGVKGTSVTSCVPTVWQVQRTTDRRH